MRKDNKSIIEHIGDFKEYLDVERGLSLKSQETYGKFLTKFSSWLSANKLDKILPHELEEEHIRKFRLFLSQSFNKKTKQPIKRSTQNYYLIALRNLLKYFADRGILSLPSEKVKLTRFRTEERAIKFLSLEQVKKLLEAPQTSQNAGLRDKAILESFFSTGLRVAELAALNKDQLKVTPEISDLEIVVIGKGGRPRPVYFSKRAVKWMKRYLQGRKDKEKALFVNYKGPKRASRRLSPRAIENIVKKYAILAGIPTFTTPHTLRHSFATDLLEKGVDLRTIQEFLGHKNIGTTQIYASVTSKKLRETHRKFHGLKE